MRPRSRRGCAGPGHTIDGHIAGCAAQDGSCAFLDGACLASHHLGLGYKHRRIVDGGDADEHRHLGASAALIGRSDQTAGNSSAVDGLEFKGVAGGFAAVMGIDQLACGQFRRGDHSGVGHHIHSIEFERAVSHGGGDDEAQGLIHGIAGFIV